MDVKHELLQVLRRAIVGINSKDLKGSGRPVLRDHGRPGHPDSDPGYTLSLGKDGLRLAQSIRCAPSILDVGTCTVPPKNASPLISQWAVLDQKPAILPVFSLYSRLQFKR